MSLYRNDILKRILENINSTACNGIIVASPSVEPNYQFHWVRDSALVIRVIINEYVSTNDDKYIKYLLDYIEIENKIQNLDTRSGLGEPRINKDGTAFNGDWGRPQNDGPALRGIMLLKILNIFYKLYPLICSQCIIPMINKDLEYLLIHYKNPCFDLWEEIYGWHWYTRMVQLKFFKEIIKYKTHFSVDISLVKTAVTNLVTALKHHIDGSFIISSFNEEGDIVKYEDAANLLAYCHVEYDPQILELFPLELVISNINNLLLFFREKYNNDEILSIGRYKNDKYYDGQAWVICTLALYQIFGKLYTMDPDKYSDYKSKQNKILDKILSLNASLLLAEQFNPNNNQFFSAEKLTWNYSELYLSINLI